jgi:putative ABC transport system permease protein
LNYLRSKDLGYDKEHLVVVSTNMSRREGVPLAKRLQTSLGNNPDVINSSISLFSMAESGWMTLGYMDNKDAFRQFRFNVIDANFVETTGLKMISGRSFSKTNTADSNYILVNEALVKEYEWKEPLGQRLPGKYQQQVIGVVRDFHFESLHTPIKPAVLALKPDSIFAASSDVSFAFPPQPRLTVRFRGGDLQKHIEDLRTTWKSVAGNQDFNYQFLDEALESAYQQEERLGRIVRYASFLSIFIACMGLFGLATLMVVRRTKEIGIRKVLGADTGKIVYLLSKDFILLIVLAALVAFPLAWLGLQQWLQDFAYRINISLWPFVGAALLAMVVAIATISIQAVKAAWMNPVESLRTE